MWHNVEQNTEEWYLLRGGKLTTSNLAKVMANYGKAFGEPAKKYAVDIAVEQITGNYTASNYSNDHMQRGHEEEPLARMAYEDEYFCEVTNGGFFDFSDIGCSPDGLIGDVGVIEIKSAIPSVHYARIAKQSYDSAYKWQLVGNVELPDREWIDFISYCSSFPQGKQLYVHRSYREDFTKEIAMMKERVQEFRELVAETKQRILNSSYSVGVAA